MRTQTNFSLTIGLTGAIASGKSTALKAWHKLGAFTLSCDELVREISARPTVQKKLQQQFGSLDTVYIAKQIFANESVRKQFETWLHPLVKKEMKHRLAAVKGIRVVEVPLLFEAGWQKEFDVTMVIVMPEKLRARYATQRGMSKIDFIKRSKAQWTQMQKAAQADFCIVNEGSVHDLENKICALYQALVKIYTVN